MKRKWAAVALAAGLFAMGACGDDDGDGGDGGESPAAPAGKSTEDICADVQTAAVEWQTAVGEAGQAAAEAAESGDDAAALQAAQDVQTAFTDFTAVLRENGDEAEDPAATETLNSAADDIDAFMEGLDPAAIQAGEMPDATALNDTQADIEELCGA